MAAGRLWEQVLRRARQAVGAISKDAEAPVKAVVSRELAKKASLRARQPAATPETSRKPFSGCSPNFPYAVLVPAPEQPAPGKQHASRDYLVSRDEFMRVAGLTEDGYQLMKLRGEGPREVVRLREEVFVVMRDMLEWNAQRNGNKRDESMEG